MYVVFIRTLEYLKPLVVLSELLFKILFAIMYVPAMQHVAESLITVKSGMLLAMPAMTGFCSTAPKYTSPITVVMQSKVPISTRMKLGNSAVFIEYIKPSPFSNCKFVFWLNNELSKVDILQEIDNTVN